MAIDLHVHTAASDGTDAPRDVVTLAKRLGLTAIAITDHDTVSGVKEACLAGESLGLEVVPGIELSAEFVGQEVHILGYFLDIHSPSLQACMAQLQADRVARNRRMVAAMEQDGLPISFSALQARYPEDTVLGRAHIGSWLIEQGFCADMKTAFARYLNRSSPYYVQRKYLTVSQAAAAIRQAGGLPVLAHPMLYDYDMSTMRTLFSLITEEQFVGAEVYYATYSTEEMQTSAKLTQEFHLIATGGSDYHGSRKPDIQLGIGKGNLSVPVSVLESLKRQKEHEKMRL